MISVILADDHRLFQHSLGQLLNRYKRIEVVGEFDTGRDVLKYLEKSIEQPDVLVTDIRMPDVDGFELLTAVKKDYPELKVIMLSMFDSVQNIKEAFDLGASAYLDKSVIPDTLVTAIVEVHENGIYQTMKTENALATGIKQTAEHSLTLFLTPAEERVIVLICEELTNSQIAERLQKSVRTIENLRQSIMEKSGAKNVAGVVKFAIRNGLFNPHEED